MASVKTPRSPARELLEERLRDRRAFLLFRIFRQKELKAEVAEARQEITNLEAALAAIPIEPETT